MDAISDVLNILDIPMITGVMVIMWRKERDRAEACSAKYEKLLRKLAGFKNPLVDMNGELVVGD